MIRDRLRTFRRRRVLGLSMAVPLSPSRRRPPLRRHLRIYGTRSSTIRWFTKSA
jgi:hypothetical protein